MAQVNAARSLPPVFTAGGAPAYPHLTPLLQLRRSVLACLLWEDEFYEDGQTIADRIQSLAAQVTPAELSALAIEARTVHNLRHVSLLLTAELAKRGGSIVGATIAQVIQRADELNEFMAIYWRKGKTPIAKQVKKGLAAALRKFDPYQLAKYDREKDVRLRDVLFLVHAKPKDGEVATEAEPVAGAKYKRGTTLRHGDGQGAVWKQLIDGTLPAPDTWEVALSAGGDKREEFTRLLKDGKLGYLALLRNLRNMVEANVDETLIRDAIVARKGGAEKVLPFRYIAAARACPRLEPFIDQALSEAVSQSVPFSGRTVVLVDVSGSMDSKLSQKSDLTRMDAACALASIIHGDLRVFSFSYNVVEVAPRRGMAGVDAIQRSQPHGGTALAEAVTLINQRIPHDRLIVITDEQATTGGIPVPVAKIAYMVNVASNKNGVGYGKGWTHVDGFSEGILRWMHEAEASVAR